MTSKECLKAILDILNYEQVDECDKRNLLRIINRDLEKLEQLEKERQEVENRLSRKETNTFDEIATMIKKAIKKFYSKDLNWYLKNNYKITAIKPLSVEVYAENEKED